MPHFPDRLFNWLDSWLSAQGQDLHRLVDIEMKTFLIHPTAATLEALHARLVELGATNEPFDETLWERWREYQEVVAGTARRETQAARPSLQMLYEVRQHDRLGSEFLAPAPADPSDIPFRSDEVDMAAKLLADHQIVIATGYPREDMELFFMPHFVSSAGSGKLYSRRIVYKPDIGKEITELFMADIFPEVLFLEAHEGMDRDRELIDAIRNGFLLDKKRRLIILYPHGATSNRDAVKHLRPFIEWILKDKEYSIPVFGLIPKPLNVYQAARYLFGQATPGYLGAARLIDSYMPLLSPFLELVKKALEESKGHLQMEEVVRKVADAIGIKASKEIKVIVAHGNNEILNLSETDLEWFDKENKENIRRPENGYEIFALGPASSSPVAPSDTSETPVLPGRGSADDAARRMRRGAGSVHGLYDRHSSAARGRRVRRGGAAYRRLTLGLRAARRTVMA